MKILVSTKALAKLLDQIPENEYVERANLDEGQLILIAQSKAVKMPVHILQFEASLNQVGRRWDSVHHLLSSCQEQPITMTIHEQRIDILLQY